MRNALVWASVGMLALGLLAPRTAVRSAHGLVAIIVVMLLIVLVQPAVAAWEPANPRPFVPSEDPSVRTVAPAVILEVADDLSRSSGLISAKVRARITAIAVGRILDHHQPTSTASITVDDLASYVSPTLASIIVGGEDAAPIGVGQLDAILAELEHL